MFAGLVDDLRERLSPLRSQVFPRIMLMELHDERLCGQLLKNHLPASDPIDAPLPALTCRQGMPLEKEPLGDLIGDLLVRDGLLDTYLLASLPPQAAHWRVTVWPFKTMPADPIKALRQLEPDLHLPFTLDEAFLDLQPLAGDPGRMLLAAAPQALVEAWIDVFNIAGAKLERLSPAQSCQFAALQPRLASEPAQRLVVLIDPQPESLRLVLLRAGLPVFERFLGGTSEAQLAELDRCLAFYRRQEPQLRDFSLWLTAPTDLQERLERSVGVPAELLDPDPFPSLVLQGLVSRGEEP